MLKRNSIIKFIIIAIIAILGILLCVCPFTVPSSADVYNGFIPAINKGVDLNGGITAVYECSNSNTESLSDAVDNSLAKIETMFETEKFSELQVTRQGGNKVYVVASGKYANELNDAFELIAEGKELSFTAVNVSEVANPTVYVDSDAVNKAYVEYDYESQTYGVKIEFTKSGVEKLKKLKDDVDSTAYVYLGEINTNNLLAEVDVDDLAKETLFLTLSTSGNYNPSTSSNGIMQREVAYSIIGGALDVDLELLEVSKISPILGQNTKLYLSIALGVIVAATFVCLIARYRHLGLLACLALTFYMILFSFFMMSLPFITLNLAGVIGSVVAFLFAVFAIIIIFEKIKDEYAMGKKIHLSCKGGLKRALWPILDSHFIVILLSAFIWIFAPSIIKGFGIALMLGALLSMFTSLVLMRIFIKNYLRINSTKAKKLGLYRDKNIREIKDEEVEIIKEDVAINPVEGGSHE